MLPASDTLQPWGLLEPASISFQVYQQHKDSLLTHAKTLLDLQDSYTSTSTREESLIEQRLQLEGKTKVDQIVS